MQQKLKAAREKRSSYSKHNSEISLILGDLKKYVEQLVGSLSEIAKQRSADHVPHATEAEDEKAEEKALQALKRNEKLRAIINFQLPTDSIASHEVTEANLIQYLGMIEHKANDLLTLTYVVNNPKKLALTSEQDVLIPAGGVSGLIGQGPLPQITDLGIVAPNTGFSWTD